MTELPVPTPDELLRLCAAANPGPWYPRDYLQETGLPADALDAPLEQLRVGGLLQLTDWVKDLGQGYALTPTGFAVLHSPRQMARLRRGEVPPPLRVAAAEYDEFTTLARGDQVRAAWNQRTPPRLTVALIALIVGWYVVGIAVAASQRVPLDTFLSQGNTVVQQQLGSVSGRSLLHGEYWRLLTSCFVHVGWLHLATNALSLWFMGRLAESLWGRPRYLVLLLLGGVGGAAAGVLWSRSASCPARRGRFSAC